MGNGRMTSARCGRKCATSSAWSVLLNCVPSWPGNFARLSHSFFRREKGMETLPPSGKGSSAPRCTQVSSMKALFLSSGIQCLLERLRSQTAIGVEEFLTRLAQLHIGRENLFDGIGHLMSGKARSKDGAD